MKLINLLISFTLLVILNSCYGSLMALEKETASSKNGFLNYGCCQNLEKGYLSHICSILKLHEAVYSRLDLNNFNGLNEDIEETLSVEINSSGQIESIHFNEIRSSRFREKLIDFEIELTSELSGKLINTYNISQEIKIPFKIENSTSDCLKFPQSNYGFDCQYFLDDVFESIYYKDKPVTKEFLRSKSDINYVRIFINDYMWDCYSEYNPLEIDIGTIKRRFK